MQHAIKLDGQTAKRPECYGAMCQIIGKSEHHATNERAHEESGQSGVAHRDASERPASAGENTQASVWDEDTHLRTVDRRTEWSDGRRRVVRQIDRTICRSVGRARV